MLFKIKRQDNADTVPYWQMFSYPSNPNETVASVIDHLNFADDLFDADGNPAPRIRWECSCMQKICGACAMVINGVPSLACNTFLRDLKGEVITIEPLRKFPVISDLIVDRSIIDENLKKAEMYLGTFRKPDAKDFMQQYAAAKCLKCGLCLEICPNYIKGEHFFGALFANESYLLYSQSANRKKEIKAAYNKHFAKGCSKSLSCQSICPMNIPTLASIAKMNR